MPLLAYLINLFNAPPLEELTVSQKLGQIARIFAAIVSVSIVVAAAGALTIRLTAQ